jgi:hypothetical protein
MILWLVFKGKLGKVASIIRANSSILSGVISTPLSIFSLAIWFSDARWRNALMIEVL